MLNLYERIFRLTNYKLYHSSYKQNCDEVWAVLKQFKIQCRLIFLNNLRTLKIETANIEELSELEEALASYHVDMNTIYLLQSNNEDLDYSEETNHELFHTSSSKKNKPIGIMNDGIGENLTEGITEYLNLRSKKKKISKSNYQRELFVIEMLIKIYGEKILEPYFLNNGKKFFNQFIPYSEDVKEIDILLEKLRENEQLQRIRLEYLTLSDIAPNILPDDIEILSSFHLTKQTKYTIDFLFQKYEKYLIEKIIEYESKHTIDIYYHQYQQEKKQIIYKDYIETYSQTQITIFKEILNKIINLAQSKGLNTADINNLINESLSYKNNELKQFITNIIQENLIFQIKKRRVYEKNISTTK